jgi:hypothetical protein
MGNNPMQKKTKTQLKWSTEFPKKEGDYWFYGYRYGKISCGQPCEPEWMIVKVRKCANGVLHVANGQFMHTSEVEEAHFAKLELPEFPKLSS